MNWPSVRVVPLRTFFAAMAASAGSALYVFTKVASSAYSTCATSAPSPLSATVTITTWRLPSYVTPPALPAPSAIA